MTSDHVPLPFPAEGPLDDVDDAVLDRLAAAWSHRDPVPDSLVAGVTFAVALDEVYAEVADIQREGARPLSGVRGATADAEAPGMSFSTNDLTMTIMASPRDRGRLRIDGWLTPPEVAVVGLRLPGETRRLAPEQGRFWFDDVPHGHVQLFVEDDDGDIVMITPAVEL